MGDTITMTTPASKRPLSPHLLIYKPQITSMMSISHRLTGVLLSIGTLLAVAWLWAVAYDAQYFAFWQDISDHIVARIILIGWTFALFYHLCNGIRHLFWDTGRGFDLKNVTASGVFVIIAASALTLGVWANIYGKISL